MSSENNLVICIPTFNRPELIKDTLKYELTFLKELNVDIYIYDSSENKLTQRIIKNLQAKGYNNLYYIGLSKDETLEKKVKKIYNYYGMQKKYKYLWLTNDVFGISKTLLVDIKKIIKKEYDLVLVNNRDAENIGYHEYKDQNRFFDDCAWRSTLFGAVIINSSLLKKVEWKSLLKKYGGKEFYYVALYFESIMKIDSFKAVHIGTKKVRYSNLKKESWWEDKVYKIWCDYWQETIYSLPDYYKNKDLTIKKLGVLSGLFSRYKMIHRRLEGLYDYKKFKIYSKKINKMSNLSEIELLLISIFPKGLLKIAIKIRKFLKKLFI